MYRLQLLLLCQLQGIPLLRVLQQHLQRMRRGKQGRVMCVRLGLGHRYRGQGKAHAESIMVQLKLLCQRHLLLLRVLQQHLWAAGQQ